MQNTSNCTECAVIAACSVHTGYVFFGTLVSFIVPEDSTMSVSEGLRLQIDALRKEKQELEVENAKLKKQLSLLQEAAGNDDHYEMNTLLQGENKKLQEEIAHMKRQYEGTLHQISNQRKKEEMRREIKKLEDRLRDETEERILQPTCYTATTNH